MTKFNSALLKIAVAASALTAVASPALAERWDDRGYGYDRGYDRDYRDYRRDRWDDNHRLRGPGVHYLDRRMFRTEIGRDIIFRRFGRDGWISVGEARRANRIWYRAMHDRRYRDELGSRW